MAVSASSIGQRVAVIGAGVVGTWISLALHKDGYRVLLVDAHGSGNSLSSSGGETRISRSGHGSDGFYAEWQRRSLIAWRRMAEEVGRPDLVRPGGFLWLCGGSEEHERKSAAVMEAQFIPHAWWSPADIRQRLPHLDLTGLSCALYEPEAAVLMARAALSVLTSRAQAGGISVRRIRVEPVADGKLVGHLESVATSEGELSADVFVFACGPWLPILFPDALGHLIQPTRQTVHFVTPPASELVDFPSIPGWAEREAGIFGLGSIDSRGVKIASDRPGPLSTPEAADRVRAPDRDVVREYLARRLPSLSRRPIAESQVCLYESTPDGHFLVDRHPRWDNVWIAGGGSGHAFKHGPAIGEYVAALLADDRERIDNLKPPDDRFALRQRLQGPGYRAVVESQPEGAA